MKHAWWMVGLGCGLLVTGCDDAGTAAPLVIPDGSMDGAADRPRAVDRPGADRPTVEGSYTVYWGPVVAEPREENTQCVIARLGNIAPVQIAQIHNILGRFSHHMVVYRTNDTEERLEPFRCTPFRDTLNPAAGAPITISQVADEVITLPPGVAFTFQPDQMIRLELHYLNLSPETQTLEASSTFSEIAEGTFRDEADFLFIGSLDVDVPARSTRTLGPVYFPIPSEYDGVHFFSITGHTHQWGTNVRVATSASSLGPATPVYDVADWLWDEPETIYHDPPFQVPAGGGFQFTCEYNNTGMTGASFGENADDEMCFFWTYYYPSRGARVCFHTDNFGQNVCCPGNLLCATFLGF